MPFVAPWTNLPDYIGASEAGARLGLSRQQMLQQAAEHAADLAQAAQISGNNASREERQDAAGNALKEEALKQAGLLGEQKNANTAAALEQRGGALDARESLDQARAEALERQKPIFSNTGGGLMQFDQSTGKWTLVPGSTHSVKPPPQQFETIATKQEAVPPTDAVPADVNNHRFLNFFGAGLPPTTNSPAIPANPGSPERTITTRIPMGVAGANSLLNVPPPQQPTPPIPQGAIDFLNANPHMAGDFSNKYGVDASQYLTNAASAAPSPSDVDSE